MNERKDQAAYGDQVYDSISGGRPVVLISHGFQTNYERGFTNGLADNGVEVTLISSDQTDHAGLRPNVRSVNLRGKQTGNRPGWVKAINLVRYHVTLCIYALLYRRSIFHVIGLIQPPLVRGVLEGIWFRMVCWRYILTVHDLLPHDQHTHWQRSLVGLSFRFPHKLVVHTARMRDELVKRHGIDPRRITVMEHGLEPLGATETITDRIVDPQQRMKILFFGIVAPYKGLDVLLTAMRTLSDQVSLVITGAAKNEAIAADISTRIASHPAHTHIVWLRQYIPENEVASYFINADVLVLPYRNIDQSGVLFQALRYGLPVVATQVGSFPEYVTKEVGEICPPDDPVQLELALLRIRSRLVELSRSRIAEIGRNYLWPNTVKTLISAYSK